MLDSYPIAQLDKDPNWYQFQIVTIEGYTNEYVVIGKSNNRRMIEYEVSTIGMLPFYINNEGIDRFNEINPTRKIGE